MTEFVLFGTANIIRGKTETMFGLHPVKITTLERPIFRMSFVASGSLRGKCCCASLSAQS